MAIEPGDPTQSVLDDGRLPIVIGITGHREFDDEGGRVRELIKERITRLMRAHPHTPFVALSPLAEGADRLFARLALDELHIPLYVPLPFDAADYEHDFPSSVHEFEALCGRAENVFIARVGAELELSGLAEAAAPRAEQDPRHRREFGYAQAGLYVAHHSHVLVAIWDEEKSRGLGGTAQIVHYKESGHIGSFRSLDGRRAMTRSGSSVRMLDMAEPGLILHVKVRRDAEARKGDSAAATARWRSIEGWHEADVHRMFRDLDAYNHELLQHVPAPGPDPERGVPAVAGTAAERRDYFRLRRRMLAADVVAGRHMSHWREAFTGLFVLTAVAVIADNLYGFFSPFRWANVMAFGAYLLVLLGAAVVILWIRRQRNSSVAVAYRALAEGLRIQEAWYRAAIPDVVARYYLRRQSERLGWLNIALRGAAVASRASKITAGDVAYVERFWIAGQQRYFARALRLRRRSVRFWRTVVVVAYGVGWLVGAAVFVELARLVQAVPAGAGASVHFPFAVRVMEIAQSFLMAGSALIGGYMGFTGYGEDVREYTVAQDGFDRCEKRLHANGSDTEPDPEQQREMLLELGIEAIHENAEWAILHEAHEASIP